MKFGSYEEAVEVDLEHYRVEVPGLDAPHGVEGQVWHLVIIVMTTIKHKTLANRILSVTRKVSPGASMLRVVLRSLPLCQAAASVVSPATPPTERKSTTAPWPCRGLVSNEPFQYLQT